MVGFVHFSNFLIPSEKYYNLQSCWITLYYLAVSGPSQQDQVLPVHEADVVERGVVPKRLCVLPGIGQEASSSITKGKVPKSVKIMTVSRRGGSGAGERKGTGDVKFHVF